MSFRSQDPYHRSATVAFSGDIALNDGRRTGPRMAPFSAPYCAAIVRNPCAAAATKGWDVIREGSRARDRHTRWSAGVNETSMSFGSERHLIGTVTIPAGATGRTAAHTPGFVIVNAGVIHRVGPHRWHVKLARHMAGLGYPSIRFDPSGQGDSRVRDVREAMDQLAETTGVKRFIVGGICSGAENGFNTALADSRIVGLWMIDGFAFPTAHTQIRRYLLKLRSMSAAEIWASCRRKLARIGGARSQEVAPAAQNADALEQNIGATPQPETFGESLQTIVDRGVSVYFIYSGSIIHLFNYEAQFRDAFARQPFLDAVRCDYRPDIDHTVTTLDCQKKLLELVAGWCVGLSIPPLTGGTAGTAPARIAPLSWSNSP
jgi:pimeloyl-ACP methyl ester carboxylesterase